MIEDMLASLRERPKSLNELANQLGVSPGLAQSALQQLQRGNYVQAASPGADHCGPVCGSCSMNSMCSNADDHKRQAEPQELWRLTAKGEQRLAPRPGYQPLPLS